MNRQSKIPVSLAVAAATCWAALSLLVPAAPDADAASEPRECLSAWAYVLTGHWGRSDCD